MNGLPSPGSAAAPPNSPIGMWSGPGPTFCTAEGCRVFVISSIRMATEESFAGGKVRRTDELFASLHQRTVTAGRGEERQKGRNRQREQHRIHAKCLNHQV